MNEEVQLRLQAIQLATASAAPGERKEEIVARANAYLTFIKGTN